MSQIETRIDANSGVEGEERHCSGDSTAHVHEQFSAGMNFEALSSFEDLKNAPTAMDTKVFGIGLNKTGTTTLARCLETLRYEVKGYDLELTKYAVQGNFGPIQETVAEYDAFQDWPWPLMYEELDERYPDSKFILTTRVDSDTWFRSLKKHSERTGPTEFRRLVYGHEMPHGKKQHHTSIYEAHNNEVRNYFAGRESDLLEVCWEEGTGWHELCDFLGHAYPEKPLPHVNKSPTWKERLLQKAKSITEPWT